jgi:lysophospholipase L1-like esterase
MPTSTYLGTGWTVNLYADFKAAVGATPLDLLCIELGTNDAPSTEPYLQVNVDAWQQELTQLVGQLQLDFPGVPILLNGPIYKPSGNALANRYLWAYHGAMDALCDGRRVFRGDRAAYVYFSQHPELYLDGTHPNAATQDGGASGIQSLAAFWGVAMDAVLFPAVAPDGLNGGI